MLKLEFNNSLISIKLKEKNLNYFMKFQFILAQYYLEPLFVIIINGQKYRYDNKKYKNVIILHLCI